ncbi:hypothetical protein FM113_16365 [Leucobacter sp. 7(1)]|nr:hypothetical protein FM113_16365 [Leucobacter sp. 7(1)]
MGASQVPAVAQACLNLKAIALRIPAGECVEEWQSEAVMPPLLAVDPLVAKHCGADILIRQIARPHAAAAAPKRPFRHTSKYPQAVVPLDAPGTPD